MNRVRVTALIAGCFSFSLSYAQQPPAMSGNFMFESCSSQTQVGQNFCTAFIAGIMDGVLYGASANNSQKAFCAPEGVTYGQGKDIFVKALREHPDMRHMPAGVLAVTALQIAFPCEARRKPTRLQGM